MSGFLQGRCCHLGVFGPRGAGKTATVDAIAKRLVLELEEKGTRIALLRGSCSEPIGGPISYAPFREALAQHFEVNLLAPPGPKVQQISQALGGLFGSVIPFGGYCFPVPREMAMPQPGRMRSMLPSPGCFAACREPGRSCWCSTTCSGSMRPRRPW